ncbi:gtp-binding protein obg : GTPase Obg OS=Singulisphaera acidiphila (strain ATCC BAA-1392 / DSM 18658 / VKM B-2454 / MOB10) GN=obg PE=3 SV=1: GTP1_OBG: MMR_HSR1 [Gemmataceae bacterium]|nr:gtp-binding protein obg : GTPase Obg OS=Singulisphaera acidiphila (strain ATCC BAA-1392 / DSM 18658 / VKM B-2454 / MOB10) GN=obg PE=3 SV=1: GTP1_OBG: MMR_HSR1 [Gemmataceae bacterium]VTT97334.1 gtp-binding protein obg : GTPase Obg OS=Singulisphaera acidiphila (strain ATCC BAA-1392 / DSM 18658 / VKM B-2454 / MOB10) GN=obg PE=3 SV=1: GTP1_OBG: MMR_HSR1 [Gemmataceae bacterium]
MFVDRVELFVKGGDGGRGLATFRREKFVPKGGPDGGDGGRGGSVIIRADPNADNLAGLTMKKHWRAKSGESGGGARRTGANAEDVILLVPPGTIIRDRDRGNVLKDLVNPGDELVAAKGGRGGRGNVHFKTSTNRAPRESEEGEEGEERWISLELKVIADAGLVGFPNAGKSTLLSRVSRATPEIASYPFTTKHPNLGIVTAGDGQFVLADLPGLIEGAAQGVGLGHEFLRHVERTRILIHLVEPFPSDDSDPVRNYHLIRKELHDYVVPLSDKPELVCVSKAELTGADEVRDKLAAELGREVLLISAVTGQGLQLVVGRVAQMLAEIKRAEAEEAARKKPVIEFGTEAVVRTSDFQTTAVASITPPTDGAAP